MTSRQFLTLLLLAAIWGGSFLLMRVATPEFGPIPLILVRAGVAALFLLPFSLMRNHWPQIAANWKLITLLGITNVAIPFTLLSYATLHVSAGFASILNATAPFFAALVGFLWLKNKVSKLGFIGLLVGFSGVVVLSLSKDSSGNFAVLPICAALVATAGYGFSVNLSKKYLSHVSPLALSTGNLLAASVVMLPLALFTWPSQAPSFNAWLYAALLAVVCTALAFWLFFNLLAKIDSSKVVMVAYLIPVFGVAWGYAFLNEQITLHMLFGGALILAGVALTTGFSKKPKLIQP